MSAISRSANSRIELLWRNMGYSYLFFNAIWISFKSVFSLVRVIDINIILCREKKKRVGALNFLSWESTLTHLLTFICCLSPSQLLIKKIDQKVCSNQTHLSWPYIPIWLRTSGFCTWKTKKEKTDFRPDFFFFFVSQDE